MSHLHDLLNGWSHECSFFWEGGGSDVLVKAIDQGLRTPRFPDKYVHVQRPNAKKKKKKPEKTFETKC